MKVIRNKFIPFWGAKYVNLFGLVFCKLKANITVKDEVHEGTHTEQMKDLLGVGFYLWYGIEYVVRLAQYRDFHRAYRNISLEREAYANEGNEDYLSGRKRLAFLQYVWVKKSEEY